jgi:hypothetical protein
VAVGILLFILGLTKWKLDTWFVENRLSDIADALKSFPSWIIEVEVK